MTTQTRQFDGINSIDLDVLQEYLQGEVNHLGVIKSCQKFSGGQSNPTFLLDTDGDYGRLVLRKQPPGVLLKSAHAVDREYRVMNALQATPVPVPQVYCLCEDKAVLGEKFFLMQFLQGTTYWDASLPDLQSTQRGAVYNAMIEALAQLSTIDYTAIGLADYGKPGNYYERQLARWCEQYSQTVSRKIAVMDWVMQWLLANTPEDDGRVSLVHGDFRLDNLKYKDPLQNVSHHDSPTAEMTGILDWELSTLGHPLADLANLCMQIRVPESMGNMSGLAGKDLSRLGIPGEAELVEKYTEYTGIPIVNWHFYVAFSLFRMAAILQGVADRAVSGNASNESAAKLGTFVEPLAEIAREVIGGK